MNKAILYNKLSEKDMCSTDPSYCESNFLANLAFAGEDKCYDKVNTMIFYYDKYATYQKQNGVISNSHCIGGVTDFMTGRVLEPLNIYDTYESCSIPDRSRNVEDILNILNSHNSTVIFSTKTYDKPDDLNKVLSHSIGENALIRVADYNCRESIYSTTGLIALGTDRDKFVDDGTRLTLIEIPLESNINTDNLIHQNFTIGDVETKDDDYFEKYLDYSVSRGIKKESYDRKTFSEKLINALIASDNYIKNKIENGEVTPEEQCKLLSLRELNEYGNSLKGKKVKLKTIKELEDENIYYKRPSAFYSNGIDAFECTFSYTNPMLESFGGKTATIDNVREEYDLNLYCKTYQHFLRISNPDIRADITSNRVMFDKQKVEAVTSEKLGATCINNTNRLLKEKIKIFLKFDDEAVNDSASMYSFSLGMCNLLED